MSARTVTRLCCLVFCAAALGCSGGTPDSPEATVQALGSAMAENDAGALWDAMPATYQADVNEVVHTFAQKVDAQVYDKAFVVARKLVDVLDTKRDYILDSAMTDGLQVFGNAMSDDPDAQREQVEASWSAAVDLLRTLVESDLSSLASLRDADVGELVDDVGSELLVQAERVATTTEEGRRNWEQQVESLAGVQVEVVERDAETATIRTWRPGEDEAAKHTARVVRVDGKWIPEEMAREWAQGIGELKSGLASADFSGSKVQIMGMLGGLEGALDTLAAAKSQEEFDQGVEQCMGLVMGAMMTGFGGPEGEAAPFEYDLF